MPRYVYLSIHEDEDEKMNLSVEDIGGELLVVSQFTLFGDCRKGKRPSFSSAGKPDYANEMYEKFIKLLKEKGFKVECGKFGADMKVELLNDGPVTLLIDSKKVFWKNEEMLKWKKDWKKSYHY